jgi:hypothetical protein
MYSETGVPHVYLPDHVVNMVFRKRDAGRLGAGRGILGTDCQRNAGLAGPPRDRRPCTATPRRARYAGGTGDRTLVQIGMPVTLPLRPDKTRRRTAADKRRRSWPITRPHAVLRCGRQGAGDRRRRERVRPPLRPPHVGSSGRIVVPFAAGGPNDHTARLMSVKLAQHSAKRSSWKTARRSSNLARRRSRAPLGWLHAGDVQRLRGQSGALQAGAV